MKEIEQVLFAILSGNCGNWSQGEHSRRTLCKLVGGIGQANAYVDGVWGYWAHVGYNAVVVCV